MANEKNIEVVENVENKTVTEYVPDETVMDKIKKFRLGKTAKKVLTGVGIAALTAVGVVVGVNLGKNRDEGDEISDYAADEELDQDQEFETPNEDTEDFIAQ